MAKALRVSVSAVEKYVARNCPTDPANDYQAAKDWKRENVRPRTGGGRAINETARLRRAQADLAELEAREKAGALVDVEDVKATFAEALEISVRQVHRLANRGMPTHSVRAAQDWRAENLDDRYGVRRSARADDDGLGNVVWNIGHVVYPNLLNSKTLFPALSGFVRVELGASKRQAMELYVLFARVLADALSEGFCGYEIEFESTKLLDAIEGCRDEAELQALIAKVWPDR